MKIALLEDNPAIYEYMKLALEMAGHHAHVYTQASELLEILLKGARGSSALPYDLITVDLHLPGDLSGYDFIHRIRDTFAANQLPIIIVSGAAPSFLGPIQSNFPHIPILQKPFQMKRLLQLLDEMKRVENQAEQQEQSSGNYY